MASCETWDGILESRIIEQGNRETDRDWGAKPHTRPEYTDRVD